MLTNSELAGVVRLMYRPCFGSCFGSCFGPFSVSNPTEFTMMELAQVVNEVVYPEAQIALVEMCVYAGMVRVMDGPYSGPFNVGNPTEFTMLELAQVVKQVVNPKAQIVYKENTADDPTRRKPDISKACLLQHAHLCVNVKAASMAPRIMLAYGQA